MKKVLSTLITIFVINATASAQVRFGIKGGLNLANVSSTPASSDIKSLLAFHGGIVLDAPISESISIQPNLLFSQKGFSTTLLGSDVKATTNYIELPINFLYHASDAFSIGAGPYLGYLLSGTVSSGGQSNSITFDNDSKRFDYGINFTAGFELIAGLTISANYSLGLANLSNDSNSTAKNKVIGVSLTKFFGSRK